MDENKDWLEVWKENSQNYKEKVKNHIKLKKQNVSNDERKKSEMSLSIKPKLMYPVFFRIPKDMKRVIRKNGSQFTKTEYRILDFIIDEVLSFHWWEGKYKPKVIMKDCNIEENPFYVNLKNLREKNIIRIVDTTKEDKDKNIYTKKKIIINPFWDTGVFTDMKTDISQDNNEMSQDNKVYEEELTKKELDELQEIE